MRRRRPATDRPLYAFCTPSPSVPAPLPHSSPTPCLPQLEQNETKQQSGSVTVPALDSRLCVCADRPRHASEPSKDAASAAKLSSVCTNYSTALHTQIITTRPDNACGLGRGPESLAPMDRWRMFSPSGTAEEFSLPDGRRQVCSCFPVVPLISSPCFSIPIPSSPIPIPPPFSSLIPPPRWPRG